MLGRTNLVVPKLLTNTKLRIDRHQGSSICGVQQRHARTCMHTHTHAHARTHTHTLSALHPNQCGPSFHTIQEADWKEKKLAVFHVFRERIGKRRGYSPKSRGRGHPREPFTKISAQKERLASQSAYEVDRVTDPVPIWEGGKENWEMAGHRMGAACVPPLAPTGSEFPVRWVETAEGSRTWAILLVSKNVAVEREDPQPTSCPHTPRSQGLDCQGRNEAASAGWKRSTYRKFHIQESTQRGISLRNLTQNSCLDAYQWTSVVCHC